MIEGHETLSNIPWWLRAPLRKFGDAFGPSNAGWPGRYTSGSGQESPAWIPGRITSGPPHREDGLALGALSEFATVIPPSST